MKKNILFALILSVSACVQASPAVVEMTRTDGAVARSLAVAKWSVDKRGVPAFDYTYKQSGEGCAYERKGHAVAGFEDNGDSVELEIYNAQDAKGNEGPPITFFYDSVDPTVVFEVYNAKKPKLSMVAFADGAMAKKVPAKCAITGKPSSIIFKNK
jgi:hypothetical protein